jgi:hypothetical protein
MSQLLVEYFPLQYDQSQILAEAANPHAPIKVKGILQRANVKNQNGRVYPKEILIRESQKYENEFIKQRRALGELDHPECVSDCDIMTYDGWRDIKTVEVGTYVATLNTQTQRLEYHPITRVINQPYKGVMYHIKGKNIDVVVTPNHRFVLQDRNGKFLEKTAEEIYQLSQTLTVSHLTIPNEFYIEKSKGIHLDFRHLSIDPVEYDDTVHCVTVENGTFYARRNGKSFWSGNSTVVNLRNVSHNITEMHWEGDDLVGTIEILSTPSGNIVKELMKNGIRLGVSSRGVGSVRNLGEGTVEVDEDFNLICFDIVSNPSTSGAFLNEGIGGAKDEYSVINNLVYEFFAEIK